MALVKILREYLALLLGQGLVLALLLMVFQFIKDRGIPSNAELFPLIFNGKRADDLFSTRGLVERFKKRGFYYSNVADATKDIKHGNTFPVQVFREFGKDLGQFLRPFVNDFAADILIVLGGIASAIEHFHSKLEDQLNIPVYPGEVQNAALLGIARLFY